MQSSSYAMSAAQFVHFSDIKHCVICGKTAVIQKGGAISCCSNFSVCAKDECGALLNCYARDGLMKFCYVCGSEMIVDEEVIFCADCQDTQTFDAPPKIQLSDIKHCPLCAKSLRPIQNGVICGEKKCTFRIVVKEAQSTSRRLTEYATNGRVRYCYACGSEAKSDSNLVVCSKTNCDSCKLPLQQGGNVETPRNDSRASSAASVSSQPVLIPEPITSLQPVFIRTSGTSPPSVSLTTSVASSLIPTFGSVISRSYQRLNEDTGLMLYKVTTYGVFRNDIKKIEKVEIGPKCLDPSVPTKVLIIVGQTGAGKSTLINAIVNYIFDIKWEDSFRFVLIPESKCQTQSQTQWITAYTFHLVQGFKISFNLTIIDTPGFGDTQGIERDEKLVDQIQEFFSTPAQYGIDHLDGILFTVKAHDSRLTPTQRYIFHAVLSVFGKDVETNIFIMATHADGGTTKVFEALHEAGIPSDKKFIFNNSALFTSSHDANNFSKMFWEMGVQSIQLFLTEIQKVESKSLTLTNEVLNTRKQLEVCIQGLQQNITEGMSRISCLRQEKKLLQAHKESIDASKDFTYKVAVQKQKLVDLDPGVYVTNCLTCNRTCHFPCKINTDEDKHGCAAMMPKNDPVNAACTACPGKCSWQKHKNNPKRYDTYIEYEVRTYEDLKKRYHVALEGKGAKESIIKKITTEKRQIEKDVFSCIQQAHCCIENLDKIALKPNPLSQEQYIELLIEAEKSDPRPGWEDRVRQYERAKKAAKLLFHIKGQTIETFLKESGITVEDLSDNDDIQTGQKSKLPQKSCMIM